MHRAPAWAVILPTVEWPALGRLSVYSSDYRVVSERGIQAARKHFLIAIPIVSSAHTQYGVNFPKTVQLQLISLHMFYYD